MKRTFLTLAFVFSFGSMALAQSQTPSPSHQQINIKAGETVDSALNAIIACSGLKSLSLDDGANFSPLPTNPKLKSPALTSAVVVQACGSWSGMMAAIRQVLPPQFDFSIDQSGILHVRPKAKVFTPAPTTTAPVAPATTTAPAASTTSTTEAKTAENKPKCEKGLTLDSTSAGVPYKEALNVIADCAGLGWIAKTPLPEGKFSGKIVADNYDEALKLLLPTGYSYELSGKTIIITGVAPEPKPESRMNSQQATKDSMAQAAEGFVMLPDGSVMTQEDLDRSMRINPRLVAENMAQMARARSTREYYSGYGSGNLAMAGNYQGTGIGYGNGYMNPFEYRDFNNLDKYGLLKIDGPDGFLQSVRVVIDGKDKTVGSKANNKWNRPIIITAGPHVVEFVQETKIDGKRSILSFHRNIDVEPAAVQISLLGKVDPASIRVSGNEFENARDLYEYRQHRYVETIDGKLEPESAKPAPKKNDAKK